MKKISLLTLGLCIHLYVFSILPPGVARLETSGFESSFLLRDSKGRLWVGYSPDKYRLRQSKGYGYYDTSNVYHTVKTVGVFTDALEYNGETYIASFDGIYKYTGDSVTHFPLFDYSSSLCAKGDSIYVGSVGKGLRVFKDGHLFQRNIVIDGIRYDSIISLASQNDILYIGTSRGLLRYRQGVFSKIEFQNLRHPSQAYIRSLAVDGLGTLWCVNESRSDTLDNLFVLENNQLRSVRDKYRNQCVSIREIPQIDQSHIQGTERNHTRRNLLWFG